MSFPALIRTALLAILAAALGAAAASGALVEVNGLVLHADGGFRPQSLPRHLYAPIEFDGYFDVAAQDGGKPTALQQAIVDFDRDGRLDVAGLPSCAPETVAGADTAEARRLCRGAIVGRGAVEAIVTPPGGGVTKVRSPLTIFNGPRLASGPSVVLHARTEVPAQQTYAILVPIVRRAGRFRYRATIEFPPIAGGFGAISRVEVQIGRRYRAQDKARSYVSARCSDHILETHGRFSFEDGTVIDGTVEKYCHAK